MQLETKKNDFAVLLMAYGGPGCLEDVAGFLADIRNGRPISEKFLTEVVERYRLIGGSSPLLEICERLSKKLGEASGQSVYLGMRHWHPFIRETIQRIASDGHERVLGICLAPHFSNMSILEYQKAVLAANLALPKPMEIEFVQSWARQERFIRFHIEQILKTKAELDLKDWTQTRILLTAHSLPTRILANGDPYVDELNQTVDLIRMGLELSANEISLVFQSASPSPEPWLGPSVEAELERLAKTEVNSVIIAPIGFVADHVEVLYDLDIVAKERADSLGLKLKRTQMLNDSHEMVAILTDLVQESGYKAEKTLAFEPAERYLA